MCSATQESECFGVRESHSEVKYERDSVQARLEHEAGQMRILREELEDTKESVDRHTVACEAVIGFLRQHL